MTTFGAILEIAAPVIEYKLLAPVLLVFAAACLGILVEGLAPRAWRFPAQLGLTLASLAIGLGFVVVNWRKGSTGILAMNSVTLDGPTYFLWGALLIFALMSTMVFAERRLNGGASAFAASASTVPGSVGEAEATHARLEHTEVFPLLLFAVTGMMVFGAANDLITMFVALEVFSLPLYLMSGMARRRRLLSQEAALKYFMLGALSSAFFLFGVALLYVYSGSFELRAIDLAVGAPVFGRGLLYAGLGMLAMGLLFKVGVVPFHNWTPDVYMGAPTPVTGFMAISTKMAAVVATLRVFYVALGAERWTWQPLFATLAVLTIIVGVVIALSQTDVKRLLAYSSIAHAGFLMTAITGANQNVAAGQGTSTAAILFYLAAYGFATIGAFAVVSLVRNAAGEENSIEGWSGLGRKHPWLAGLFALFLLSFAGIPLTGGFIGKWAVFAAAWRGGYAWLVVLAVLASLVAAYFYLRVIAVMFIGEPAPASFVGQASAWTWVPIIVGAVGTLLLGIAPDAVMQLASLGGTFLR